MSGDALMMTYKRADGELIHGDWVFALDREALDNEAEYADAPIEYVEQRWALVSERRFFLPICGSCDAPATHWGLCERHAREDDPEHFTAADPSPSEPT
jgi:hypothetical protein